MSAKYLVTAPPGVAVPGIGFVRVNSAFVAPAGFKPSKTFKALNAEASAELAKLRDELLARAKAFRATSKDEDPEAYKAAMAAAKRLDAEAAAIELPVFELPKEEAKVEVDVAPPSPAKNTRKL